MNIYLLQQLLVPTHAQLHNEGLGTYGMYILLRYLNEFMILSVPLQNN